jgi:hypothetical protein
LPLQVTNGSPAPALDRRAGYFLLAAALAYVPLTRLGFGSDGDSDAVMATVYSLISHGRYHYSRPPSFPVHEAGSTLAFLLAGPIGPNLASLAMSVAALALVMHLCRVYAIPHALLVAAGIAVNPFFIVASTSTIDYMWATAFVLGGTAAAVAGSPILSGVAFGLACGARLSCVLPCTAILTVRAITVPGSWRQAALALTVAGLVTILCYIPAFVVSGYRFGFVTYLVPDWWGGWSVVARFVYKNIYLFGLQTCIAAALILARRKDSPWREHRDVSLLCLAAIASVEAVFARVPIEIGYLLPMLPFVWLLLGMALGRRPRLLAALVIVQASYGVISFNIAKPDVYHVARAGRVGFWVEPGVLVSDTRERLARDRLRHPD